MLVVTNLMTDPANIAPSPLDGPSRPAPGEATAAGAGRCAEVAASLLRAAADLSARGWCLGTSGNFSVTLDREPLRLLITRSGRDKGRLAAEDLLVVNAEGRPVGGEGAPSAEALLHCAIAEEAGAGSVLHTHTVAGTLLGEHFSSRGELAVSGYEMLKGLEGIETHEAEVVVPVFANAQDMAHLAGRVRRLLASRPRLRGFLIAGHGLYAWGETLVQAKRHVEVFEFLFQCLARRTRFEPFTGKRLPGARRSAAAAREARGG